MKIAIEIKADGELCGKCQFGDRWHLSKVYYVCTMFRTSDGRSRSLRNKNGKPKRCRQCIEATIESDGE